MSKAVVYSRLPQFSAGVINKLDDVLLGLAGETERNTKMVIPHNKGTLQSSVRTDRIEKLHYRVSTGEFPNLPYASVMENKEGVRYSKPGKKAHALRDSGEKVARVAQSRIARAI